MGIDTSERYYRVSNGLKAFWMSNNPEAEIIENLKGSKSHFISTYFYNKSHAEQFKKTKSVAGIKDALTDKIWFDFDSDNIEDSRKDAVEVINRLIVDFPMTTMQVFFSGNKGIHVIFNHDKILNRKQVETIVSKYSKGLETFDSSLYDQNQILRIPNTIHESSGLYKIPLTVEELNKLSIPEIKSLAKTHRDLNISFDVAKVSEDLLQNISKKESKKNFSISEDDPLKIKELDFTSMPLGWKNYKWSIANGRFEIGKRNHFMMIIASTCRALKYGLDHTRSMCETADRLHCEITRDEPMDESSLENEVLNTVFSDHWKGGQYSPENDAELKSYCEKYGFKVEKEVSKTVDLGQAFKIYKYFKQNSGKFVVSTGIPSLDSKIKMTIGQTVGIVAGPSVGKTSLGLQILNTMNKKKARSLFFSYDMYISLVIQKLMQKHTNLSEEEIDKKMASMSQEEENELLAILQEEYGNVGICFETGQNVDDITKTLLAEREKYGDVNLVVIDYNELISSSNSDSTEASKEVAQKLRSLANLHNVCVIILMQPNKISGGPSDEIRSYRAIKGSSMSEQSLDVILGLSRPGFTPEFPDDDKFLVINCLKNRYGKLFRLELLFDGYNSEISEIVKSEDKALLQEIKDRRTRQLEEDEGPAFDRTTFGQFRRNNNGQQY